MNASELWNWLIKEGKYPGFEVHTVPKNKQLPKWFHVESDKDRLIVRNSNVNTPSVELTKERKISYKDFELVYSYFGRWVKGETGIRHEVSRQSRNTAYIFALITKAKKKES